MRKTNRSNALLVELMIVVIFFMLASTVLLRVFTESRNQGQRAGAINEALVAAQNTADRLYAAEDGANGAIKALKEMGFQADAASGWFLENEEYRLTVYLNTEDRDAGLMQQATVTAYQGDLALFSLPVARYEEAQP